MSNQIVDMNAHIMRKQLNVATQSITDLCEAIENLCTATSALNDYCGSLETRIAALEDKLNEKV